ncbi:GNAT family N-acetyltransferase [Pseudalkalibacillus berkeleyi]|uniref:GNAT family N-acetyltransferase n=1 Tax=Pseudalkalibacillus berkeleyi TaxID=1069813 RepID=A0ABS9H1Q7_9BACL|nr:GNAT family N-acetyltransferase [Pseudalkalibacillus berkeleyi]MCF6137708.1 GNAT family N-acetyltransferase [Pseudalkalibacillus berkeleyi]
MEWVKKTFQELTKGELYTILQKRVEIFVVEQECPYPEVDGRDEECLHIWSEINGEMAAYCRIVPPLEGDDDYSIGRVLIAKPHRGRGIAREMMNVAIDVLVQEYGVKTIALHGQEHLRNFYGSFGFKEVTDVYLEDGIPHVDMLMVVADR